MTPGKSRTEALSASADGSTRPPQILVIDNYDSFAYNLVQYVGSVVAQLGGGSDDVVVRRNDEITLEGIDALDPDGIVVSPGPGTPAEAGISVALFAERTYPTLGVCLGHQALCVANGATVDRAASVVHGKASEVTHDGAGVFASLPDPVTVGRYHSLAVEREALPDALEETAYTVGSGGAARGDDETGDATAANFDEPAESEPVGLSVVMGVRHRERPHVGVQFHPESILTDVGTTMIENFCIQCTTT